MTRQPPVARDLIVTGFRFILDASFVHIGLIAGVAWRFGELLPAKLAVYFPATLMASVMLPCCSYIGGLYSPRLTGTDSWARARWFFFSLSATLGVLLAAGSVALEARLGRGVLLGGFAILIALYAIHHFLLARGFGTTRFRAVCVVSGEDDVRAVETLAESSPQIEVIGLIFVGDLGPECSTLPQIGRLDEAGISFSLPEADAVLVRDQHLGMPCVTTQLRQWRYQGIEIISLADACEMVLQAVPLTLVTENWLFRASSQSGMLYIKKLKRLFDIASALMCLLLLWPFLMLGILAIRLFSKGPVFFRQVRMGRLGREFVILKLRTMCIDAEKDGPRWSSAKDTRVFPVGAFLRRFRIDEIPQLINILRGEMSFVGPRPERPEFFGQLEQSIPYYRERMLVQPGLTGWAQVKYPYGASAEDAWRKHEFDLYYIKHMSILLDFLILLETTRTVLMGGNLKSDAHINAMHQWKKLGCAEAAVPSNDLPLKPELTRP